MTFSGRSAGILWTATIRRPLALTTSTSGPPQSSFYYSFLAASSAGASAPGSLCSLAEFRMADNRSPDPSVLLLLRPLSSLRILDVSGSAWLGNRGLHHIARVQGLSQVKLARCEGIRLGDMLQMVSCCCRSLTRIMLDQAPSVMLGYSADVDIERRLCGPVGACSVYSVHGE